MALSGPQAIPNVTLQEAYRFQTGVDDDRIESFVYKALPRRILWKARIDGSAIVVTAETRREASNWQSLKHVT
jgi:hypothetical protein